jgi:hypothetical protein
MGIQRELFRPTPRGGAELFKTYGLARPMATHWRVGTCAEVQCVNNARGWQVSIDLTTDLGQKQARYIRDHSGRKYTIVGQINSMVTLEFPAGQKCFTEHRVPLEREPICYIRGGDFRGNPMGTPSRKLRVSDWVEDFGGHQEAIKEQKERG